MTYAGPANYSDMRQIR